MYPMEIEYDVIPDEKKPLEPPFEIDDMEWEDEDEEEDDYSNKDISIFSSY